MTTEEFLDKFNGAPYDLEEVADLVSEISDSADLVNSAKIFLDSQENFRLALSCIGFEFG